MLGSNIKNLRFKKLEQPQIPSIQQPTILKNQDNIFLYFLKFKSNFLYDNFLTINVYRSLKLNKNKRNISHFNIKNLFLYIIHNFFIPSKLNDFTIELEWKSKVKETCAIYEYYRVIIFNILNFIISNSKSDNKNKKINIILDINNFVEQDFKFKVEFEIYDDKVNYISYEDMKRILETTNIFNLNSDEIKKFELFDIGIFVAYNILQRVYNRDSTISTHQFGTKLSFFIKGVALINKANNPAISLSSTIYNKSINNTIKIDIPKLKSKNKYLMNVIEKTSLKQEKISITTLSKYIDDGKYDKCEIYK